MKFEPNCVRVLLYAENPLNFRLIFSDGYEKDYVLDDYAVRSYRGATVRDIIADQAELYFELLGEPVDNIQLIFM